MYFNQNDNKVNQTPAAVLEMEYFVKDHFIISFSSTIVLLVKLTEKIGLFMDWLYT